MSTKRNLRGLVFLGGLLIAVWAYAQGGILADNLAYNKARTHYYTVADGDFVSGNGTAFGTSSGTGGTFMMVAGSGWLAAGLHLPDGAVITEFRAYVNDVANGDLNIGIKRREYPGDSVSTLASVDSFGATGIGDYADTTISSPVIDNQTYSYYIRVYSVAWPGDATLTIKGAVVTYTIAEAD